MLPGSMMYLASTVLAVICLLELCKSQVEDVTLVSQCVREDGDIQLSLTCTVQNVAHLFWFFDESNTRHYEYFRDSADEQCPCDPTFDSMLPGVQVTVQEATGADRFDAVSILAANVSSLLALNIHSVECGSANTPSMSVIINSDIQCTATLSLTSQPETSGSFCPGPVTFTCVGTEVDSSVSWLVNGSSVATYQYQSTDVYPLVLTSTVDPSSTTTVSSASTNPSVTNTFDVVSTLSVSDVSILDKATLHCQDASGSVSDPLNIQIGPLAIDPPPLVNFTSCSLHPSTGGKAEVSLPWSSSFTSQHGVERYRVSVNPDPSSCSSDQVSPSEDYSCSGLVLGTRYTFIVSAINCGDQEGEENSAIVFIEGVTELSSVASESRQDFVVQWVQSSYVSVGCLPVGDIEYMVELVDNTGEVVEQRVVTSDSCSNGTCSILIPPNGTCLVRVQATSPFGNFMTEMNIAGVRLTATNLALLVTGVILLSVAIVIILILMTALKKGSKVSFLLLLVGCFLVVLSMVLWIAVALQVGLQENTCDPSWQSTRDDLIIAAHVISDLAFLVEVAAAGLLVGVICCSDYCTKSTSNKALDCLFKWFCPHQTKIKFQKREGWQIQMRHHGQFHRGRGGRVEELEGPAVMVDEFRSYSETKERAFSRAGEEIFHQYDHKLKETEAQYDTIAHVKTPKGTTPTQAPAYSHLNRCEEQQGGGETRSGEYQHLDHINKRKDVGGLEISKLENADDLIQDFLGTHQVSSLPDLGGRLYKYWFAVHRVPERGEREELILTIKKHPYIHSVSKIGYISQTGHVVVIQEKYPCGSLRDELHGGPPANGWMDYRQDFTPISSPHANIEDPVAYYGWQILQGLKFLYDQGFPPLGHAHTGNIYIHVEDPWGRKVCKVGGYDNTLLGYSSKLMRKLLREEELKKPVDLKWIDVIQFGHVLYEMAEGKCFSIPLPSKDEYRGSSVEEVLDYIFEMVEKNKDISHKEALKKIMKHKYFKSCSRKEKLPSLSWSFLHGDVRGLLEMVTVGEPVEQEIVTKKV